MKKYLSIIILAALLLSGCNQNNSAKSDVSTTTVAEITEATTDAALSKYTLYVDFSAQPSERFEMSDGWCNGNPFNVTWRKSNVEIADNLLTLTIDEDSKAGVIPYAGGEYRSKDFYGYGRYEVSMKAIKNDGVVSSFFTYTGPSDNNPWDEIDIEVLGKDTEQVQFNYYTDGVGNHEYMHELGFDASEDFHTYAFEWHKDKIIWFVDGVEVYSANESIPVTEGKIMMNAWCGKDVDEWLKEFDSANLPLKAEYQWLSFTAFDE